MFFQRQVLKFKRNYLCTLETEESLPSWLGYCVFPTACDALDKIQILPLAPSAHIWKVQERVTIYLHWDGKHAMAHANFPTAVNYP